MGEEQEEKEVAKEVVKKEPRTDGPIICPGHSRPVPFCTYSKITEYGYFLMSACLDGKAMLREGPSGNWIGTFLGHKGAVWCARLNEDATQACTAAADFTAKLWNAETGECLHTFTHKHIVKQAVFSKDSQKLFTGGAEKKLRIYDLENQDAEPQILMGHTESISFLELLPDPNMVVSGGIKESQLRLWDLRSGECVKELASSDPLTGMSMSHDQSTICSTAGKTVTMWDSKTFEKIKSFELPRVVDCVAFDPNIKKFVTGSDCELWVRVYDFESGKELACNKGHHGPVRSVDCSPDGKQYVSGSEDGTLRIWEYANIKA